MGIVKDIKKGRFGMEGQLEVPWYKTPIEVDFEEDVPREYVEKCARAICGLPEETLERLCAYTVRFLEEWRLMLNGDVPIPVLENPRDILAYITLTAVRIDRPPEEGSPAAYIVGWDCEWEPEHGLVWLLRDGKAWYVGCDEGLPIWDEAAWEDLGWYDPAVDPVRSLPNSNFADKP